MGLEYDAVYVGHHLWRRIATTSKRFQHLFNERRLRYGGLLQYLHLPNVEAVVSKPFRGDGHRHRFPSIQCGASSRFDETHPFKVDEGCFAQARF